MEWYRRSGLGEWENLGGAVCGGVDGEGTRGRLAALKERGNRFRDSSTLLLMLLTGYSNEINFNFRSKETLR